jgi:hypothetical protein
MSKEISYKSWPGWVATALVTLVCTLWTFWGVAEMFHEGWWGNWGVRLAYLIPAAICLIMGLIVMVWPRVGGWVIIIVGAAFTLWWWGMAFVRGGLTFNQVLVQFPVSGILIFIGGLFLYEAKYQKQNQAKYLNVSWLRRNLRWLLIFGFPGIIGLSVSIHYLPIIINRVDDNYRGEVLIENNLGQNLIWAPQGPGWNWQQDWGGYPSWSSLALYGQEPLGLKTGEVLEESPVTVEDMLETGLCRYLSEDGLKLLEEPQDIWRMPTTMEIVSSLSLHDQNAGCIWDGESFEPNCQQVPDKETPLWAPDEAPIYYWSGEEFDKELAFYVSYNGWVQEQPKGWGNPRHGYRCVKMP